MSSEENTSAKPSRPATTRQVQANRANAQKSTGPKSDLGKTVSAQNAVKHGALAKTVVAVHEDRKTFEALIGDLNAQFEPQSVTEEQLVQSLAMAFWRNRRLAIAEKFAMENERMDGGDYGLSNVESRRQKFGVLSITESLLFGRYQTALTYEIQRNLVMLRQEQDRRMSRTEDLNILPALDEPELAQALSQT